LQKRDLGGRAKPGLEEKSFVRRGPPSVLKKTKLSDVPPQRKGASVLRYRG